MRIGGEDARKLALKGYIDIEPFYGGCFVVMRRDTVSLSCLRSSEMALIYRRPSAGQSDVMENIMALIDQPPECELIRPSKAVTWIC